MLILPKYRVIQKLIGYIYDIISNSLHIPINTFFEFSIDDSKMFIFQSKYLNEKS